MCIAALLASLFQVSSVPPSRIQGPVRTLWTAAVANDVATVRGTIDSGAEPERDLGPDDMRKLLDLVGNQGHVEMTVLLLQPRARTKQPPATQSVRIDELLRAANRGDARKVQQSLEGASGFDDRVLKAALLFAQQQGHIETIRVLRPVTERAVEAAVERQRHNRDLCDAAGKGDVNRVRALLESGAECNAIVDVRLDRLRWTALHAAAEAGSADVVRVLLDAGGDPDVRTSDGRTAWDLAKSLPTPAITQLLDAARARREKSKSNQ